MRSLFRFVTAAVVLATLFGASSTVQAQPPAVPNSMNFQGRLASPSGNPVADGTYSVRFRFYDQPTEGDIVFEKTLANVVVKNGTFAVKLDGFTPDKFEGNTWLALKVGSDMELSPRLQIVSVPYAIKSNLALTVPDGSITNAKIESGTLTADRFAGGALNAYVWLLGGNSETNPTSQFLGTTDDQPLEFRVNGQRAFRLHYAANTEYGYRSINVLGGSQLNTIAAGVVGSTIAGGGFDGYEYEEYHPNTINADFALIGGGTGNTVSGGSSSVVGGDYNVVNGMNSVIGGGVSNFVSGDYAIIGSGRQNEASGAFGVVGGGVFNNASKSYSTVAGGDGNTASGSYSMVGGGLTNTASGVSSAVLGGMLNTASGHSSMAAGSRAKAEHEGTFVWKSYNFENAEFASTAAGQFLISAYGGVGINTNAPGGYALNVNGDTRISGNINTMGKVGIGTSSPNVNLHIKSPADAIIAVDSGIGSILYSAIDFRSQGTAVWGIGKNPDNNFYIDRSSVGNAFFINGSTLNVGIGTVLPSYKLDVNGSLRCTSFTNSSDVRFKKNIADLPDALDSILNLHGVSYEWRSDEFKDRNFGAGRQIGFIAQEVEKLFPELVSTDANGYKSVNYIGVVPVLVEAVKTQQKQMDDLKAELAALKAAVAELKAHTR